MKICPNPYCRYENQNSSKFCEECGHTLPTGAITPQKKKNRNTPVAVIGGVTGIACGGLIILGWLTPWISLGGLGNLLLSFLNIGSGFQLFDFGAGIGNGLQLSLLMLVGSLAALSNSDTAILGLFGLAIVAVMVLIPVMGAMNIRTGFKFFDKSETEEQKNEKSSFQVNIKKLRSRFSTVFVILVIVFIILAMFPFLTAILGRGFYLTLLGSTIGFLGSFLAQRIADP